MNELIAELSTMEIKGKFAKDYLGALTTTSEKIEELGPEFEKEFVTRFFDRGNFHIDKEIIETIDNDTVAEAYLFPELVQVFRTLNFFSFGSYDTDTMLQVPFTELFHREEFVSRLMYKEIIRAVEGGLKCSKFNVPTHILKEVYGEHDKMYQMTCRHIGAITENTGQSIGFICTYKAKEIYN